MANPVERGTRERILEVAEASLGQFGYHGTRLHEIARRVGIQKASLFHYFLSKEHLYKAVIEEGFGETDVIIRRVLESDANPWEKLRALIRAYVQTVAAHPARTKILLRQSIGDAPAGHKADDAERLLRMVADFCADAQRAGIFAAIDPVALVLSVVGMVAFFFTSVPVLAPVWLGDPSDPNEIERITQHVIRVVERSLGAEASPDHASRAGVAACGAPAATGGAAR